jgi:hypothetical protein
MKQELSLGREGPREERRSPKPSSPKRSGDFILAELIQRLKDAGYKISGGGMVLVARPRQT